MEEQGEESFNATLKSEEIESREHSVNKHPANKSILSAHGGEVDGAQSVNENPEDEIISSSGGDVDNRQSINENPEEIISSSAAGEVDDRQSVNENPADDIIPSAVGGEVADGQSVTENPADETVLSAIAGEGGDSFSVDVKLLEEIKGRIKLKQFANVMEAFELVMGISIIVMALEKFQDLEPVFKVCPNALLRNLFGQSLFIGVITTICTSLSHIIGSELIYKPLTSFARRARKMRCILCALFVSVVSFHTIVFQKVLESGASEVTDLLHQGMTFYLEEPNWKRCFDKLHQTKRCCGVFGVDDWLSARWLTLDHLQNRTTEKFSLVDDDGGILGKTLPASCCSPYANQPCVHDLLQQQHNSTVIGTLIRPPERDVNTMSFYSSVYRRGCARDLLEPIQQDAVFFITVLIIIDVLHVCIMIIGEYLYNACQKTAHKLDEHTLEAMLSASEEEKKTKPSAEPERKLETTSDWKTVPKRTMIILGKVLLFCLFAGLVLMTPLLIIILPIILIVLLPIIFCLLLPAVIIANFWSDNPESKLSEFEKYQQKTRAKRGKI